MNCERRAKVITFNYNTSSNRLQSISWGPSSSLKYITYTYSNNYKSLKTVELPEGDQWYYEYHYGSVAARVNTYHLENVYTPTGGHISYTFDTFTKSCGGAASKILGGLRQKTVNDGVSSETWDYEYGLSPADNGDYTTITEQNSGRTVNYIFYGLQTAYNNNCYKYGLTKSKTVTENGLTEETDYSWGKLNGYISPASYSAICACSDANTYVPVLTSQTVKVDDIEYSTTYSNFDNYGNPETIVESGDVSRTTSKTYWYNTTRNMVKNYPSSVAISGDSIMPGNFSSSYTYHTDSENYFGKLKKKTQYGISTEFGYDSRGNLDWIKDANGKTTYYNWSNGSISKITNPIYSISRTINWDGTVANVTNGRGHRTYYSYDDNMRLTLINPPTGNSTTISYLYDTDGYLTRKREKRGSFWQDYYLDGLGRSSGTKSAAGATTTIRYRPGGIIRSEASNIGDTTYYDALGRVSRVLHQDGNDINYTYLNNVHIQIKDEANNTTDKYYRYLGNPSQHHLNKIINAKNETTEYAYNTLGSLTQTSRGSVTRFFHYNSKNLMNWESHPETGTTNYTRYANGNLKTKNENSITTTYTFDAINRLTNAVSGNYSQNFSYDNADNITKMTSKDVTINNTFDSINRLTKRKSTIKGKTATLSYSYDGNDNIKKISYPSGLAANYTYNWLNRVTKVSGFGGTLSNIQYYTGAPKIGLLKSYTRPNGQTVSYTWNNRRAMYSSGPSQLRLNYRYDSRGNMTQLQRPGRNQSFGYDKLNRMNAASGPWGSGSYSYDTVDNRKTKTMGGTTTSYSYSSNRVSSETGKTYSYNGGNVSEIGNYSLFYDPFNNIITSKRGGTTVGQYCYDAQNNRVYKKAGAETVYYHYGLSGNVLSELDNSGSGLADYIYLNGILVARSSPDQVVSGKTTASWMLLLLKDKDE